MTLILVLHGTNVNQELVKQGWCWSYRKYAPVDADFKELENTARKAKKGLWVHPAPLRHGRGEDGDAFPRCSEEVFLLMPIPGAGTSTILPYPYWGMETLQSVVQHLGRCFRQGLPVGVTT